MGRLYTSVIDALSVSAICELWYVSAAANKVVILHEVVLTQDASETSEQLPLAIFRTATDQGSKGGASTPSPLDPGDPAFAGTVKTNILTAEGFATPSVTPYRQAQNVLGGWHLLFTPETRLVIGGGAKIVVKLPIAPSAALTLSGYLTLEEIG